MNIIVDPRCAATRGHTLRPPVRHRTGEVFRLNDVWKPPLRAAEAKAGCLHGRRAIVVSTHAAGRQNLCTLQGSSAAPHQPGEQLCARCAAEKKPPHRVYMHFQTQSSWHSQFLEEDLKTPLSKKLNLVRQETLFEIAEGAAIG